MAGILIIVTVHIRTQNACAYIYKYKCFQMHKTSSSCCFQGLTPTHTQQISRCRHHLVETGTTCRNQAAIWSRAIRSRYAAQYLLEDLIFIISNIIRTMLNDC